MLLPTSARAPVGTVGCAMAPTVADAAMGPGAMGRSRTARCEFRGKQENREVEEVWAGGSDWLSSFLRAGALGLSAAAIAVCASCFGGCQRRAPQGSKIASWVNQLYGPTLVLILETGEPGQPKICAFWYTRFPGDKTPVSQREARENKAMEAVVRLSQSGDEALPHLYQALHDQRRIPRRCMVGFFKPEDEEILKEIRVCDKAAAVFSEIAGERISFVEFDADGIPHRLPPSKREQILRKARRIVEESGGDLRDVDGDRSGPDETTGDD